jgi:beta-glucosidase
MLLIVFTIWLSFTTSLAIDPKTNSPPPVKLRSWEQAITMAKALVAQLTLQEKCNLTEGVPGPCVGNIAALPRVNLSGFCI